MTDNYGTTVTGATLSGPTPLGDFDTPISSASGNSAVYNATGIAIPFTATDTGIYQSGLDHLNLYMIHNNS